MNLIHCSNDCKFQKEGCCTLESPASVTSSNLDCCYYVKDDNEKTKERESHFSNNKNTP